MFEMIPLWLRVFIFSMIPWLESRYVIPFAIIEFGLEWWQVFPVAVLGNMLPVPFILLFFRFIETFLRRYRFWAKIMDWLFTRTRARADKKIRQYEHLALLLFVAIPLPFTGAWTGALIAYLFDLKFSKSLLIIFIGVVIAASIMTVLVLTGQHLWFIFNG